MREGMEFTVEKIDHLVINVGDPATSAAWYTRVLGMRGEVAAGRTILWFGDQKIHLRPVSASQNEWFTARQAAPGTSDVCFSTPALMSAILAHLQRNEIVVELGPVEREGARGPMLSAYCRDPDGNLIEISTYAKHSVRPSGADAAGHDAERPK
jgi:catechol 2,3-dioxygenase-like lactoylglutathione lyase family enzyme